MLPLSEADGGYFLMCASLVLFPFVAAYVVSISLAWLDLFCCPAALPAPPGPSRAGVVQVMDEEFGSCPPLFVDCLFIATALTVLHVFGSVGPAGPANRGEIARLRQLVASASASVLALVRKVCA